METFFKQTAPSILSLKKMASSLLRRLNAGLKFSANALGEIQRDLEFIRLMHLDFVARSDDIFIVTYPRSGTTWLQMILYQLTTDGEMNFPHISRKVPWIENSLVLNTMTLEDIEAQPSPRVFKTHLSYRDIPKRDCRYIYVARNGKDVVISFYQLYRTHLGFKGTFPEFFHRFMKGQVLYKSWFKHVSQWWTHRNDANVLFLFYEDLISDLEHELRKIIDFCALDIPAERIPEILERCSFTFMKKHEELFDPITEKLLDKGYIKDSFLRKGKSGEGKQVLNLEQKTHFDEEFTRHILGSGLTFEKWIGNSE